MLFNRTFVAVGAAFGTSKAGIGIAGLGTFKPELIMKVSHNALKIIRSKFDMAHLVPHSCGYVRYHCSVWASSVCPDLWFMFVYICVLIYLTTHRFCTVRAGDYSLFAGFIHLGAGLACGFTGLAAGYAIGFVGDSVRVTTVTIGNVVIRYFVVRPGVRSRIESLRRDGAHSHFCGSFRVVWVRYTFDFFSMILNLTDVQTNCCSYHEHDSIRARHMLISK